MTNILKIFGAAIGVVVLFVVLALPLILLNGWVISWMWLWFLVPLGLPAIGVVHAMGIAGAVGLLTKQYVPQKDNYEALGYGFLAPLFALGAGYVIHLFM